MPLLIIVSSTFFGLPNKEVCEMTPFNKDRPGHKIYQTALTSDGSNNEK